MTTVPIPEQYRTNTIKSWDKYRTALDVVSVSMQKVARNVLYNYLNLCSLALGRATVTSDEYVDPPTMPAIETVDGSPLGEATGKLIYPS